MIKEIVCLLSDRNSSNTVDHDQTTPKSCLIMADHSSCGSIRKKVFFFISLQKPMLWVLSICCGLCEALLMTKVLLTSTTAYDFVYKWEKYQQLCCKKCLIFSGTVYLSISVEIFRENMVLFSHGTLVVVSRAFAHTSVQIAWIHLQER